MKPLHNDGHWKLHPYKRSRRLFSSSSSSPSSSITEHLPVDDKDTTEILRRFIGDDDMLFQQHFPIPSLLILQVRDHIVHKLQLSRQESRRPPIIAVIKTKLSSSKNRRKYNDDYLCNGNNAVLPVLLRSLFSITMILLLLGSCLMSHNVYYMNMISHAYTTQPSLQPQHQNYYGTLLLTTICNQRRIHQMSTTICFDPQLASIGTTSMIGLDQFRSRRCTTTTSSSTTTTLLFMGKGDGKQKRTKKSTSSSDGASQDNTKTSTTASSTASSQQQPLRVSSNINVPVRQQIAIAQMNKIIRQQQQSVISSPSSSSSSGGGSSSSSSSSSSSQSFIPVSKPRVRTAYRRTWEEEEIVQKAEERKRRGQEPNWDVILNRTAASPLLIVDGYNIIHAWPRLKKHMTKGDPSRARQLLIDDLENLQSIKGWRIECVFDGTRRSTIGPLGSGPGSASSSSAGADQATKQSLSKFGVRVVYSAVGMEADTYIEGRCLRAKNVTHGAITGSLIVATDDAMIRLSGQNAGAVCMSSLRFVDELKAVQKTVAYRVEAAVAKVNGHSIRPEQLRGSPNHVAMPTRFGRRSVVIEDKRNRTKVSKKDEMIDEVYESYISSIIQKKVEEDENGIPWWAKAPEQSNTNFYKR